MTVDHEVDAGRILGPFPLSDLPLPTVCLLAGENLWQIVLTVGVVAPGARNIPGISARWKQAWSCSRFCDDTEPVSPFSCAEHAGRFGRQRERRKSLPLLVGLHLVFSIY